MRAGLLGALALWLCGCAGTSTLSRTRTTQTESGRSVTSTALASSTRSGGRPAGSAPRSSGVDTIDAAAGVLEFLLNLPELLDDASGPEELELPEHWEGRASTATARALEERARGDRGADLRGMLGSDDAAGRDEDGGLPLGLSAGYARTRIWSGLQTSFDSASLPNVNWDNSPRVGGTGLEASVLLFGRPNDYAPVFGEGVLSLGSFERAYTANATTRGSFFVREKIDAKGYWANAALRVYFKRPLFVSVLAGLFYYKLNTSVETNAPVFVYEGVSGERIFGSFGLGGGLRTPWDFPLQALLEGRVYLTTGQDPVLESAIGQALASLAFVF